MYGVRARLLHFLVKIRQVAAPCSISLRQILMKVHSFSKFDMSNRNHDKAVFFGLYEKYEQFRILRDIGYVNHLLFSRALSLSRQNTRSGSRPPKFQSKTQRIGSVQPEKFRKNGFWGGPRARSIQQKFRPVRPGKVVHLKRWTNFFETFPVGPSRSIAFWTEISGNFGWMDRAL